MLAFACELLLSLEEHREVFEALVRDPNAPVSSSGSSGLSGQRDALSICLLEALPGRRVCAMLSDDSLHVLTLAADLHGFPHKAMEAPSLPPSQPHTAPAPEQVSAAALDPHQPATGEYFSRLDPGPALSPNPPAASLVLLRGRPRPMGRALCVLTRGAKVGQHPSMRADPSDALGLKLGFNDALEEMIKARQISGSVADELRALGTAQKAQVVAAWKQRRAGGDMAAHDVKQERDGQRAAGAWRLAQGRHLCVCSVVHLPFALMRSALRAVTPK